jgi:xanthine dehydrogenase accessory factor
MLFSNHLVVLRGGGDLATGVAYRLHKAGFPIVVLELPRPLVVRRRVALATAVLEGEIQIEELCGKLVSTTAEALELARMGIIPVLVAPELPEELVGEQGGRGAEEQGSGGGSLSLQSLVSSLSVSPPTIIVDARVAKRNIDTRIDQASLVVALGPGFTAGVDCHAVVETMRGHTLGRVIWRGVALPDTGTPGLVAGKGAERVLRAPVAGIVSWRKEIGDRVQEGELLGEVEGQLLYTPFDGVVRGLIAPGTAVRAGLKIGDIDARDDVEACFTISDKALAIGGGVLEAVLTYLSQQTEQVPDFDPAVESR